MKSSIINSGFEALLELKGEIGKPDIKPSQPLNTFKTIVVFPEQDLTIYSNRTNNPKTVKRIIEKYGKNKGYNTSGSRPVVAKLIPKGDD